MKTTSRSPKLVSQSIPVWSSTKNKRSLSLHLIFSLWKSRDRVPKAFGSSIPMKSTFFITYIMVDGWSTVAAEVLRLWALLLYHVKNVMVVKTEKDRNNAMVFTTPQYHALLPKLGLYCLLGLVYSIISPLILPFIIVFFAFGYIIYRNQVLNASSKTRPHVKWKLTD